MQVTVVKVLVLVALFLLTFILGITPIFLKRYFRKHADSENHRSRYKTALSFISCFAAGVFLGTGVLDLLPDVREDIGSALKNFSISTSFPVAEFVMMVGLFMILIVEQIVLLVTKDKITEDIVELKPEPRLPANRQPSSHTLHTPVSIGNPVYTSSVLSNDGYQTLPDHPLLSTNCKEHGEISESNNENKDITTSTDGLLPIHNHSSLRSMLLIVAISLHSVFEGLAVGLQQEAEEVLNIFAALLIHKSILSFCIGLNLLQSGSSYMAVLRYILVFSLTSPIGIGIGIAIMDLGSSKDSLLAQGILTGIACGTFLYVVFFEMLPEEFNNHHHRMLKLFFLLAGFATVTGVLFLQANDEGSSCT